MKRNVILGKTYIKTVFLILMAFAVLGSCDMGSSGGGNSDNGGDGMADDILRDLNVAEVDDLPDLDVTDSQGSTVTISDPETWHPLKNEYTVFTPKAEVFQLGLNSTGRIYQDADEDWASSNPFADDDELMQDDFLKICTTADLDGDAIDEIVVFYTLNDPATVDSEYRVIYQRVYHNGSFSDSEVLEGITCHSAAADIMPVYRYYKNNWDLEKADVNGDGIDEILFKNHMDLYVLNISADGSTCNILDSFSAALNPASFCGGDCDGDGEDELMVCYYSYNLSSDDGGYALYDSDFDSPMLTSIVDDLDPNMELTQGTFGDFDGDRIDEIAVIQAGANPQLYIMSWNPDSDTITENRSGATGISADNYSETPTKIQLQPRAVDIDGDGLDELVVGPLVYNDVMDDFTDSLQVFGSSSDDFLLSTEVLAGDVDGDAREDVIFYLYNDDAESGTLMVKGLGTDKNWDDQTGGTLTDKRYYASLSIDYCDDGNYGAGLKKIANTCYAVGNIDNDSNRVRYTGHELMFSTPTVIATLASAPYYEDIADEVGSDDYNYPEWITTFGRTTTSGSTSTGTVGFSVGISVETEAGPMIFGLPLVRVETSQTFQVSLSTEFSFGHSVSKTISYEATGGEDRVIFTSVPMDVYSYEVLNSPEPDEIGMTMTIKLPRDFSVYTVQKDFYNANNGDLPDVPDAVFSHTPGDPTSYRSASDKDSIMAQYAGGYEIGPEPAGQGTSTSGTTSLEIVVEDSEEYSIITDLSYEYMAGVNVAGIMLAETRGFNAGYAYTSTSSEGTSFGGTVGFLPTDYFNDPQYSYSSGLFVYPYEDAASGQSWWAVDYWVE